MSTATKLISASGGGGAFELPEHLALVYQTVSGTSQNTIHRVYHESGTLLASKIGNYGSTTAYAIPSGGYGRVYSAASNVSQAYVYEEVGGTNLGWVQKTYRYNSYPGLNRQYIWLNETTFMYNNGSDIWDITADTGNTSTTTQMPAHNGEAVQKVISAISYKGTLYAVISTGTSSPYKIKLYSFDGTTWTYLQTLDTNHTSIQVGQPVFDYEKSEVYFTSGTSTAWKVSLKSPTSASTKYTLPGYLIVYNNGLFYGSTNSSGSTLYTSSSIDTPAGSWTTVGSWGDPGFSYPDVITTKNRIWMHRGYSTFTKYDYYDIPTNTFGGLISVTYSNNATGLADFMTPVSTAEYGFSISPTY